MVGGKKRSGLFVWLLRKLLTAHATARRIHVILDNYVMHSSRQTRAFRASLDGRIVRHFPPPYCPNDNRIGRSVGREAHADITRSHGCETIQELVPEARRG